MHYYALLCIIKIFCFAFTLCICNPSFSTYFVFNLFYDFPITYNHCFVYLKIIQEQNN